MQRKEIDRTTYEAIRSEMTGIVETICKFIAVTEGHHEDRGEILLIRQAGRFFIEEDEPLRARSVEEAMGHSMTL